MRDRIGIAGAGAVIAFGVVLAGASRPLADASSAYTVATRAVASQQPASVPGWAARYVNKAQAADARAMGITAWVPAAAFVLNPGESIHPAIEPDGFVARFDAELSLTQPGKYRFGADVEGGSLRVMVFGGVAARETIVNFDRPSGPDGSMSNWIDLPAGKVNVQYTFTRSGGGPARLRALWEQQIGLRAGAGFRREPISAHFAVVPPSRSAPTDDALRREHGRVILGELNCLACHDGGAKAAHAVLSREAPDLRGIGSRASVSWLARYIADPQKVKPGCSMPDLFAETKADTDTAAAIAAYLGTLIDESWGGPMESEHVATEPDGLMQGKDLYQSYGCVACHDSFTAADAGSPPPHAFGDLKGKWRPSSLAQFLMDPAKARPAGRMPNFDLAKPEADLIATFLITQWGGGAELAPAANDQSIAKGKLAFAAQGCVSCHATLEPDAGRSGVRAKALKDLAPGKGCLDSRSTRSPRYGLDERRIASVSSALAESRSWSGAPAPTDIALRSLEALSCVACHQHAGRGGVRTAADVLFRPADEKLAEDEGRLPPVLTGVGNKLTTSWLQQVLSDGARARPYMRARMPRFGENSVGTLADCLSKADGTKPNTDRTEPAPTDQMTDAGRRIVGVAGLNCINCHVAGDYPSTGTPGPDIQRFADRLRFEWFDLYMHAPQRFKPGTRMTTFFQDGKGTITEFFGGDARKQVDALWSYFNLGSFMPLPEGLSPGNTLKIQVGARPIILRTFLRSAQTRGIAVGFPAAAGGVHFAFDAERVRLADAWSGDFLDASGAWANRGGSVVQGQGARTWQAPAGVPILIAPSKPEKWPGATGHDAGYRFGGYRVDADGSPIFLYSIAGSAASGDSSSPWSAHVEEKPTPIGAGSSGVRRAFLLEGFPAGSTAWINAGKGKVKVSNVSGAVAATEQGPDAQTWVRLIPSGSASDSVRINVTVEVTP